ncbi:hypothetical protein NEMIN01_2383 [Nematocida minor]|uniref:uncharacterized protein n=1 Tax=Nematocida minor TaxID=1912983 RepID=UPI0022203DF9|nr:uncharacterized protein NEMIN01_2383 [Nematocida minor]KAI5193048.1 hypothetical protein NEMIN01_2383 [Nematocida minor]
MKEARLKINTEGILKACKDINTEGAKLLLKRNAPEESLTILKEIFGNGNLVIESKEDYVGQESDLLDAIKNLLYRNFAYNGNGANIVESLRSVLLREQRNIKDVEFYSTALLNELLKKNTFIYSPEHGINRGNEVIIGGGDNSTTVYKLEIDETKFLSLKNLAESIENDLNREFLFYMCNLVATKKNSMGVLKELLPEDSYYSLDDLYSEKYEGSDVALVDYGLELIHKKYDDVRQLIKIHEDKNKLFYPEHTSLTETTELFTKEELRTVVSIIHNIEKIKDEKKVQKAVIEGVEYLMNSTDVLKENGKMKKLEIDADLSNFIGTYVAGNNGLETTVRGKIADLDQKILEKNQALDKAKEDLSKAKKEGGSWDVLFKFDSSIEFIKNQIYLLECNKKKEEAQIENISNLHLLDKMSLVQKKYIHKEIEKVEALRTEPQVIPQIANPTEVTSRNTEETQETSRNSEETQANLQVRNTEETQETQETTRNSEETQANLQVRNTEETQETTRNSEETQANLQVGNEPQGKPEEKKLTRAKRIAILVAFVAFLAVVTLLLLKDHLRDMLTRSSSVN